MAAAETPIGSPRATPSIGIATPVDVGRNTAATATATCTTASQDGPSESSALLESEELRDRRLFLWQVNSPDQGNTKKQHHCRAESLFEDSDDDCSDSALVKSPLKPRDLNAAFDAVPPPMEMDLELGREVGSEGRTGLKFQPEKLSDCVHDVPVASWQRHMLEFFGPRMQPVTFHRPLRLGTSCSGTGAPRIGLRTLGFPVLETASADPKPATMKFMRDVAQLSCHHFASVDNLQKRSGYCHVHEKMCTLEAIRDDLYVAGFPCSPFSRQRADRFTSAAGWRAHPQAAVMFGVAADIRTREPLLAVLENVTGFVMASKDEAAQGPSVHHPDVKRDSPLDALLSAVNDGTDVQHPRYFACWQHVDGDLWSGFPRPRVYIMLVHRDLGVSVLKDAACILRDALEHCKGKEPLTFAETLLPKDSTVLANQMAKHQANKRPKTATSSSAGTKWQAQEKALRSELPPDLRHQSKPWTGAARLQGLGGPQGCLPRTRAMIDLAFLFTKLSKGGSAAENSDIIRNLVVDVSQALERKPWGLRTLLASTSLYSFEHDRLVLPMEGLRLLGFSTKCLYPSLSQGEIADLVGNAMSLPSVTIVCASLLSAALPRLPGLLHDDE
ncbi:CHT1 [Symbiodinium sp. CCMP2592]|nr:CHT1 [Symbiodinium sp. CCMP2592]